MEPVVFSGTPGVLDAVVKISVLFTDLSFYRNYRNSLDPLGI